MAKFNFQLADDKLLDGLAKKTQATTKADVVRDALSVYNMLLKRVETGEHLFVGSDPSSLVELHITPIENARPAVQTSASAPPSGGKEK